MFPRLQCAMVEYPARVPHSATLDGQCLVCLVGNNKPTDQSTIKNPICKNKFPPVLILSLMQAINVPTGEHYGRGAVTCYACRAFFRRVPTRKRPPRCKRSSRCQLDQTVKIFCGGCRYQKCLR